MLPMEDQVLLQNTLVSLSVDDTVIEQIMTMLEDQAEEMKKNPVPMVQENWFGDSRTGGYRLATNTTLAGGVVETEMSEMLIGLRQYRDSIKEFADDMKDTDESISMAMANIQNAANCTDDTTATTCTAPTENS